MNKLMNWHFDVQKGMYFDRYLSQENWSAFLSDIIEDEFWNYAVLPANCNLPDVLPDLEKMFATVERTPSVYIINGENCPDVIKYLEQNNYKKMSEESFMVFDSQLPMQMNKDMLIKQVMDDKTTQDFIEVFLSAYGGEKTPEQPYGELNKTYLDALTRSFENSEKFIHFVCYKGNTPVSVATLCFEKGKGGLYNVGTMPDSRGKGHGTAVTIACINEWKKRCGKVLFLQTETGSAVEQWYYKLGFKLGFVGSIFCKE